MIKQILLSFAAVAMISTGAVYPEAFAGGDEKPAVLPEGVRSVNTAELKNMLGQKGVYVFDSRNGEAYTKSHVDGAVSLPLDNFDVSKLPSDKNAQLVFYCGGPSCTLAPSSAGKAKKAGYTNVAVYHDGISGWTAAKNKES